MGLRRKTEIGGHTPERPLLLRLFVAGDGPNSREALANLEAICRRCLQSNAYQLEIIDVLEEPLRALEDGVLVTPTLLTCNSRQVSIVGTLRDHQRVMQAMGLTDAREEQLQDRPDCGPQKAE